MQRSPRLQPLTRARVLGMGETGAAWVTALPQVLGELESRWSISVGRSLPGGSASYVVAGRTHRGVDVVVKIAVLADGWTEQVAALQRADGRGYVRLLATAADLRAVLLERLGPSLAGSGLPPEEQLIRIADTLARAWRRPGDLVAMDKAAALHELIRTRWEQQDRPCSERVITQALKFASRRSVVEEAELMLVHGDPHPGNLLAVPTPRRGAETGWCFVDPDGVVTDRAYDLGVALRDWSIRLLQSPAPRGTAEGYCRLLSEHTGVDETRIWEWGFVERVSTGLYVLDRIGSPAVARPFLDSAELLL